MAKHIHLQAQAHDGTRFVVVERNGVRAETAALVIRRAGGRLLGETWCAGDYQTCRRAACEQRSRPAN